MHALTVMLTITLAPGILLGQEKESPYSADKRREIKSLSKEEIDAYHAGQGMGLAKAAELNRYPGPKHVIDLADQLDLTPGQLASARLIYTRMNKEAIRVGRRIVDRERELDRLFAEGTVSDARMRGVVAAIGLLQGRLRSAHLQAHLEMRKVLTREQVEKYDHLRGYSGSHPERPHKH
jgi:Spy/CpxP family protein refolding chaperone